MISQSPHQAIPMTKILYHKITRHETSTKAQKISPDPILSDETSGALFPCAGNPKMFEN
jgi:hypothetical protein